VGAQLALIVADIVGWRRGWPIAAALVTGALMVWMNVQVWISSIPRTGTAALDGTLLLVLLMPSAVMMVLAATDAQLARDIIEKLLPALDEPRRAG